MEVVALVQCDAGEGAGRKALFPGQRYDLPEDTARGLLVAGLVRETNPPKPVESTTERPRGRKR